MLFEYKDIDSTKKEGKNKNYNCVLNKNKYISYMLNLKQYV